VATDLHCFLNDTGTLRITAGCVTADLTLGSHHSVLVDAGFADLELPIAWWKAGQRRPDHPVGPGRLGTWRRSTATS
jgi:hypothetical protein